MSTISAQRFERSSLGYGRSDQRVSGSARLSSSSRQVSGGRYHAEYEVYGNTVRQPRYDGYAEPARPDRAYRRDRFDERELRRERRPEIGVIPGQSHQAQAEPLPSSLVFLAKVAAVVLAVVAVLACGRIALSSAAVTTALETRELSSQIETARSEGNALEVVQSSLSNPTRVKDAATLLGMSAPAYVANIDLSGDVVVTDAQGNLSLSGSAAVLTQGQ